MEDLLITALNIAFWLALHFGLAAAFTALPQRVQQRLFDPDRRVFHVSAAEVRWYRRIGLPRWKDRLPQYRAHGSFDKRRLAQPRDPAYLAAFLQETCKAEVIHRLIGVLGYLSLFFCLFAADRLFWLRVYALIATLMLLCNLPFALIQRYNRSRLRRVREKLDFSRAVCYNDPISKYTAEEEKP